ncbi:MAG: extracellular solute-binding protein [Paenibacillaceae bacterium]|nr:extracellular solute-binding protein [Paenibacillaceae bacterium]
MRRKLVMPFVAMLAIVAAATGCSETVKEKEPVEIRFFLPSVEDSRFPLLVQQNQLYQSTVDNFHKANPHITVKLEYITLVNNKFTEEDMYNLLQSEDPPDIYPVLSMSLLQKAYQDKLLLDLLPVQRMYGTKEIDIDKQILDSATIDGQLLALPVSANPLFVLYHKKLFDAADIPYPQEDWTWEQFQAISKQLNGGPLLEYSPGSLNMLMAGTGKQIVSPGGDAAVGYLDSAEAVQTLRWLNDYYREVAGKEPAKSFVDLYDSFSKLQTGMFFYSYLNQLYIDGEIYDKNKEGNIAMASLPHFAGTKRANPVDVSGYGIAKKSKHPQEAWQFLEYFALSAHENTKALADFYLSTSKSVAKASGQNTDPIKKVPVGELKYAVKPMDSSLISHAWTPELTAGFQALLTTEDKDIPAALHALALKLDQELARLKAERDNEQGAAGSTRQ